MLKFNAVEHHNIKGFITHGGLLGTLEALICGVPLIGIPLYADQFMNIDMYVKKNIALKLDLNTMTEKDMDKVLNSILWNPMYMYVDFHFHILI